MSNVKAGDLAKPKFGAPCNGCGLCCRLEVCAVGKVAFPGADAPCPGLNFSEDRYWCELVRIENRAGLTPILYRTLAIGAGCDSEIDESTTTTEREVTT